MGLYSFCCLTDNYLTGAIAVHTSAFLPNEPLPMALAASVNCAGSEASLLDCPLTSHDNAAPSCTFRNYVQVVCQGIINGIDRSIKLG